jgi:hypothetical protein
MVFGGVALLLSGLVLWFVASIPWELRVVRYAATLVHAVAALATIGGCTQRAALDAEKPDVAAYLDFVLPKRIEIQKYLTKPVSFAGDGNADGILVVLAAYDSIGDQTKAVGQFSFELERFPKVSDQIGEQVAVWPVPVNSDETLKAHWDRLTRSYRFPLKLEHGGLKPGKYRLSVRLTSPNGEPLFHQYEFTHEAGAAPMAPRR